MSRDKAMNVLEKLKSRLAGCIREAEVLYGDTIVVRLKPDCLPHAASVVFDEMKGLLMTSAGVDERPLNNSFTVYHLFSLDREGVFLVLASSMPPSSPRLPSITPVVPGANWIEREIRDLLGIEFEGHPDPRRLVLPDDWPENIYPLRKEFPYNLKSVPRKPRKYPMKPASQSEVLVPIGPYHPALHEPEYFRLYVKGDEIVDAEYRGFGVYRGIEKLAEGRMTYNQVPFIAERICGICGFTHSCCYCQAVERAAGISVPERALYIRTLLLELERLHSHLLLIGVAYHLLGFDTGFMHCWRIREKVMDICEVLTGNRKTYGMNLVGGVRRDFSRESLMKVEKIVGWVEEEFKKFLKAAEGMRELEERMVGVGVLDRETARRICVVGPVARASGLDRDVRRDHPYAAYGDIKGEYEIPVYSEGDVWARVMVRVKEVFESIRMIRILIDRMPGGEIMAVFDGIPEKKMALSATEAPRGEDVHFVITGRENRIYRWKVRAPTYNNLPAVPPMLRGNKLADAPIIIASIDPCFSCTDRVVVVDVSTGSSRVFSQREFILLSRKRR